MWGILLPLILGIAVGYFSPGRQNKTAMFKRGLLWAVIIALVIVVIGYFTGNNPLTAGGLGGGFIGLVISFVVSLVVFLVGVWIGDMIEGRRNTNARRPGA